MNSIWLVEIRVRDWIALPPGQSRAIAYEEVEARGEFEARHAGFDAYTKRIQYEPIARRKFEALGIGLGDYCAPDAVELEAAPCA